MLAAISRLSILAVPLVPLSPWSLNDHAPSFGDGTELLPCAARNVKELGLARCIRRAVHLVSLYYYRQIT